MISPLIDTETNTEENT